MDDPLYGMHPDQTKDDYGYNLGAMDARSDAVRRS
jgi:hypothetical protein